MNCLVVMLLNGRQFFVEGESIDDVPDSVPLRGGDAWSQFKIINGCALQIRSEQIAAINEVKLGG